METSSKTTRSKHSRLGYLVYLIPILAILAGYGAIVFATGESYPFTIVIGPSMEPTIPPESVAIIQKVPFDQLQKGDIIVFTPLLALLSPPCDSGPSNTASGEAQVPCFVIHRIVVIGVDGNGNRIVTTKGDNNPTSLAYIDTGINESMYIGKVVFTIPDAGYLTKTPYNEIIALLILGALIGQLYFERTRNLAKQKTASSAQS